LSGDFYELIANKRTTEDLTAFQLVCASQNGVLLYQMNNAEMKEIGAECLCEGYVGTSVELIISPSSDINKIIHEGQLLIQHEDKTYNVIGMEVK
jgi:alpha-D-ribose 1-methylphosphonate 5-triphosphate synthase subunit PhnL